MAKQKRPNRKGSGNAPVEPDLVPESWRIAELADNLALVSGSLTLTAVVALLRSRLEEILPVNALVLFLLDDKRTELRAVEASGNFASELLGRPVLPLASTASKCFADNIVVEDENLKIESKNLSSDCRSNFGSSVSVPLKRNGNIFGVLQVFFSSEHAALLAPTAFFEELGLAVSPVFLNSMSFERTGHIAMTDPTTELPNERAFYQALEQHIANCISNIDERPFTVVAFDIDEFGELSEETGPPKGDQVLKLVGGAARETLRTMDLVARTKGDEFLMLLPTADQEACYEIMTRIRVEVDSRQAWVLDNDELRIFLNFGCAEFGPDGDTAESLIRTARIRKTQITSDAEPRVLWFNDSLPETA